MHRKYSVASLFKDNALQNVGWVKPDKKKREEK
jgi:hypothetical protein